MLATCDEQRDSCRSHCARSSSPRRLPVSPPPETPSRAQRPDRRGSTTTQLLSARSTAGTFGPGGAWSSMFSLPTRPSSPAPSMGRCREVPGRCRPNVACSPTSMTRARPRSTPAPSVRCPSRSAGCCNGRCRRARGSCRGWSWRWKDRSSSARSGCSSVAMSSCGPVPFPGRVPMPRGQRVVLRHRPSRQLTQLSGSWISLARVGAIPPGATQPLTPPGRRPCTNATRPYGTNEPLHHSILERQ